MRSVKSNGWAMPVITEWKEGFHSDTRAQRQRTQSDFSRFSSLLLVRDHPGVVDATEGSIFDRALLLVKPGKSLVVIKLLRKDYGGKPLFVLEPPPIIPVVRKGRQS